MGMDPALREKVRRFHLRVTLLGGLMLVAASLAAAYIFFLRPSREFPRWLLGRGPGLTRGR